MNRIIRQAFGSSRPRDIWLNLLTFDRMVTRPVVHIVYWVGLGLLAIVACAIGGVAIGSALHESEIMAWLMSFVMIVVGWLGVLIGVLLWRSFCEFYLAVLSIAEDLRYLRQFQEKLPGQTPVAAPAASPAAAPVPPAKAMPETAPPALDAVAATFDAAVPPVTTAAPGTPAGNPTASIVDAPFFQPRFGKQPKP